MALTHKAWVGSNDLFVETVDTTLRRSAKAYLAHCSSEVHWGVMLYVPYEGWNIREEFLGVGWAQRDACLVVRRWQHYQLCWQKEVLRQSLHPVDLTELDWVHCQKYMVHWS